jgi:hypothetical protein
MYTCAHYTTDLTSPWLEAPSPTCFHLFFTFTAHVALAPDYRHCICEAASPDCNSQKGTSKSDSGFTLSPRAWHIGHTFDGRMFYIDQHVDVKRTTPSSNIML